MGRCRMARRTAARHSGRAADTQAAETEAGHVSTCGGRDPEALTHGRAPVAQLRHYSHRACSAWSLPPAIVSASACPHPLPEVPSGAIALAPRNGPPHPLELTS